MKVKVESETVGLKLNIKKTDDMASSPITSWQIEGEKLAAVTDFLFFGSKINADSDYSREIRRLLLLGMKAMTNLDSRLKSKDITFLTKVPILKAMVFLVVMYGCENWTIKKVEHQRIDVFKLWCWRRLLRVPCTARRSNQSILKEVNPEYSLEGLMLKLKLQYFGHLMQRANSLEKTLMLEKIEGKRRGQQRCHHQFSWHEIGWTPGDGEEQGGLECWSTWGPKNQTWLSDWTTTIYIISARVICLITSPVLFNQINLFIQIPKLSTSWNYRWTGAPVIMTCPRKSDPQKAGPVFSQGSWCKFW